MGKSSSQVVGYRYYAKFAAFIGNRIEKLIAINFDNRKWVVHDPLKHPPNLLPVLEGNLFGENEGGVSGNIDIHFGTPDQEPNAEYQKYFPLVSGYPYQSYLVFRWLTSTNPLTGKQTTAPGFYLGNSGYMKEMLLWVKRIHVKNNGDVQWYDLKAEIDNTNFYEASKEWTPFNVVNNGWMTWSDPSGSHKFGASIEGFPMSETSPSYEAWPDGNGPLKPEQPGIIAASETLMANNLSVDMEKGTILPPATWTAYPPTTDGFWNGVVERQFFGEGDFWWNGGVLKHRSVMSNNGARVSIFRLNGGEPQEIHGVANVTNQDYSYQEGEWLLDRGFYRLKVTIGQRAQIQSTPRPFLHFEAKVKPSAATNNADINPIHKIREILTDDTAMGKPESDINDVNFIKAADRIWDERLGISWAIDEKSCIDAIEELCYHIEAGVRVNRQTGLYEMVLFRDDWFAEDEIHTISENKIKDLSLEVMNSDDIVNQLNVTYYDRRRIKNSTFSIYENGSILTMGHANAESIEFPYFMNMRNAEIVANWKLKQFSTPAWSGSFTTGWREARKWNRYDLIRLPWSKKWNGTILARIMKINLGNGTDNTVTIDFEEVIPYSGEMNTSIVVDAPVESAPQPPQPSINAVFEAPYYLTVLRAGQTNTDLELLNNPEIGYVAAIAAKPQSNSLNALLYTDGGIGEFEQVSRLDYCDILQLDQPINETASAFVVTGSLTQTANSNNLILLNGELMGFVAFDDATKVLTVKRGVLDTVPKKHSSGSLFVFDLPDVAFDSTQYAQSEIIEAQVLTTTPSGIQDLSEIGTSVEIQARAIRPYPPANVTLNGEYWPVEVVGDVEVTWNHRNRLQQTASTHIDWFAGDVAVEPGVEYGYELYDSDTNMLIDARDGLIKSVVISKNNLASNNRLELFANRDGIESYDRYTCNFSKLSTTLWTPEDFLPTTIWLDGEDAVEGADHKIISVTDKASGLILENNNTDKRIYKHFEPAIGKHCFKRSPPQSLTSPSGAHLFGGANHFWTFFIMRNDAITGPSNDQVFFSANYDVVAIARIGISSSIFKPGFYMQTASGGWNTNRTNSDLLNDWSMVFMKHDLASGTFEIYVNGVLDVSGGAPSGVLKSNSGPVTIGDTSYGFEYMLATIMMGTEDVTADAQKLFGWAAHEYNLTRLLPEDHQYKTTPPMI